MHKRHQTLAIITLFCITGILLAHSTAKKPSEKTGQEQTDVTSGKTQEHESEETESPENENSSDTAEARSYLTGLPIGEEQQNKRPLAVMLSNIRASCPQTGIEKASVIYEAPVEGRITRLMGLFEDWESIEKIGYIRSSRDYFVYCALEHDAVYCHFGQATMYVGTLLNSDRVDNISAAVAGIDHPAYDVFRRTTDRRAPHNVVASGKDILKNVERFGYSLEYHDTFQPKFIFISSKEPDIYKNMPDVNTIYPGGQAPDGANGYSRIQAYFEYDGEKYYRYQYGGPHIDEATGNQLTCDNVILQYCYGEVRDENDYLAFGCHGDNGLPVQVFTQGKVINGTWSRYSDNDPAVYLDEAGNPIKLTPGKTWICIIWTDYAKDVEFVR